MAVAAIAKLLSLGKKSAKKKATVTKAMKARVKALKGNKADSTRKTQATLNKATKKLKKVQVGTKKSTATKARYDKAFENKVTGAMRPKNRTKKK